MSGAARLITHESEFLVEDGIPAAVRFVCPACHRKSASWGHSIIVPWNGALRDRLVPSYPLWEATGTDDLDAMTISPSINGNPTCAFHGWIRAGEVTW